MRTIRTFLFAAGLLALTACDKADHELTLVTPIAPIERAIVEDLAELFADEQVRTRIELTEKAMAGGDALDAIVSGEADIALVSNNFEFRHDVATVMPLYPTVLHIARRADVEGPIGPDSLRGTSIYAGEEGSASRLLFDNIARRTGLDEGDYRYITDRTEIPDVVVVFAPISPQRLADIPHQLVLSSLGTPADIGAGGIVDASIMLHPHFRPFVIPVGVYGDATPEPIVTIAVDKIIVARSDLGSSAVYDLINDIMRLRPALAAKRPGLFQRLSEDFDASRSRFVLHAGTLAYLQREAPTVYERYSGIAEVVVTVLIAAISATFAGVRIFRMRRKNRIDRYYAATIAVRNTVGASQDPAAREDGINKIRELQNEAFDLLVDEKLAADESFRIFITLSNDVLRQLGAADIDQRLSDA